MPTGCTLPVSWCIRSFTNVSVTAETSSTDGKVAVSIGGVSYSTVASQFDSAGGDLQAGSLGGGTGIIRLYKAGDSTTNPNDYLDVDIARRSTSTH